MHRSKIPDALRTLIREGDSLLQTAYTPTVPGYGQLLVEPAQQVATERSAEWSTSTMILLRSIFGQKSELYERAAPYAAQAFMLGNVKQLIGIVRAALFAWENDYVFSIEEQVEEQVETTLLDQAQLSFRKQEAWGASVLAGAALEQHLRALCPKYGVELVDPSGNRRTLGPLNEELYGKSAYSETDHKHIALLMKIRNDAAHGTAASMADARKIVDGVKELRTKLA